MVFGYHVIFGAYGFWLPNDPRGSWSDFVGSWELFRYGAATTIRETRSLANAEHDVAKRLTAKRSLMYPPVQFSGIQARAIARGFASYVRTSGLSIWACAILPDHIHLVIGRFRLKIEQTVIQLKGEASSRLIEEQIHPFGTMARPNGRVPRCFARGEWSVYLEEIDDIHTAIQYVEQNPVKEGKKAQMWSCVTPFAPSFIETLK
jgi:REP element-mobilizing transposase RayT